jgi:hypothetical protein
MRWCRAPRCSARTFSAASTHGQLRWTSGTRAMPKRSGGYARASAQLAPVALADLGCLGPVRAGGRAEHHAEDHDKAGNEDAPDRVLERTTAVARLLGLHAAVRAHHPGLCTAEVDRIDAVGLLGDRCPLSRNDRASRAGRCCRGSGCGERDTEDNQQRNSDTTHGLIVRANGSREATGRVGT